MMICTLFSFLCATYLIHPKLEPPRAVVPVSYQVPSELWVLPKGLSAKTHRILHDLIQCESRGNPRAVNPKDKDGTASWGLLQFKPSTLFSEGKRFGFIDDLEPAEIQNRMFDAQLQVNVASRMVEEGKESEAFWKQQFPACSKLHNYWEDL